MGFYKKTDEGLEQDFAKLPTGIYPTIIVDADYKENKKGTGMILVLVHEVTDDMPAFAGVKVYENINIEHEKANVQQMARRTMNTYCELFENDDLEVEDFINKPLAIKVVYSKSDEYGEQNNIKGHYTMDEFLSGSLSVDGEKKPASSKSKAASTSAPAKTSTRVQRPEKDEPEEKETVSAGAGKRRAFLNK